jgi:hypothetical protein
VLAIRADEVAPSDVPIASEEHEGYDGLRTPLLRPKGGQMRRRESHIP